MKSYTNFQIFFIICVCFSSAFCKDGKKKKESTPKSKDIFDSATIKCLVCKSVVDEFKYSIAKVDPKKMVESGTFRVDGNGVQAKTSVRYSSSLFSVKRHLTFCFLIDSLCSISVPFDGSCG